MDDQDYAAIGRGVVKLGISAVYLGFGAGGLWMAFDLWGTWQRGEIHDAADVILLGFLALVAASFTGSAAYGMFNLWIKRGLLD